VSESQVSLGTAPPLSRFKAPQQDEPPVEMGNESNVCESVGVQS